MKLSPEALFALAAEKTVFKTSEDALDRFASLVGPIFLGRKSGSLLTAPIVVDVVDENFGIPITLDMAGALLFRLDQGQFITSQKVDDKKVFTTKDGRLRSRSAIDELIVDFRKFVDDKILLPKISDEEILDLFMAKIFEISSFLDDEDFAGKNFKGDEKWKLALISDYVLAHTDENGGLPSLLTKLAELCLMRSVVGNLMSHRKNPKRSQLKVLLDAPVALFAIGASGKAQQSNVISTLELARSFGVQFQLLPTSAEEISRVIHATLANDHRNRRGYTAAAIRRGDLIEAVADDMRKSPEKHAKNAGISMSNRNLSTFPNEVEHFSAKEVSEFSVTAARWANSYVAQTHDAECLAITMRARSGKHDRDIFSVLSR